MTARYRARAKIRVTLTLIPSRVTCAIAVRPSGVAGIFTNMLSRSTADRRARAMSAVAAASHTGQPGVDLDGDPPVFPGCLPVHRGKDVTGGADVFGGDREDGGLGAGTQLGQVTQLGVIPVALRQRRGEDRGVGRHADDVPGRW